MIFLRAARHFSVLLPCIFLPAALPFSALPPGIFSAVIRLPALLARSPQRPNRRHYPLSDMVFYTAQFRSEVRQKEFIDAVRCRNGNLTVTVSRPMPDREEL